MRGMLINCDYCPGVSCALCPVRCAIAFVFHQRLSTFTKWHMSVSGVGSAWFEMYSILSIVHVFYRPRGALLTQEQQRVVMKPIWTRLCKFASKTRTRRRGAMGEIDWEVESCHKNFEEHPTLKERESASERAHPAQPSPNWRWLFHECSDIIGLYSLYMLCSNDFNLGLHILNIDQFQKNESYVPSLPCPSKHTTNK